MASAAEQGRPASPTPSDAASSPHLGSAVLVHGTWGNPEDWFLVRRILERRGVHVVAPDLASHGGCTGGLRDDADVVGAAIRACEPPVVAVGWSYGGAVITAAADAEPGVARLVYVGSVPRDEGFVESDDWLDDNEHVSLRPDGTHVLDDRWWREEEAGTTFPDQVREVLSRHPRRPTTRRSTADAQVGAAWRATPTVVLMGVDDPFLTEADIEWMQAHPELDVRMLDCDHFLIFRSPAAIADAVLEVLATGRRGAERLSP